MATRKVRRTATTKARKAVRRVKAKAGALTGIKTTLRRKASSVLRTVKSITRTRKRRAA